MARPVKGKFKMSEAGRERLRSWISENGESYASMGRLLHLPTASARGIATGALWISPEHLGLVCAWSYGDLEVKDLLDRLDARKAKVPHVKPRKRPEAPPPPPSSPAAGPGSTSGGVPPPGDVELLAGAETTANINALRLLRDDPRATTAQKQRAIETLLEYGVGKPRQRERPDEPVTPERDEDLVLELKKLVAGARRRLEALAEKAGKDKDPKETKK